MKDRGEHRQHGFHQHPRVPAATRTDFHVGRITPRHGNQYRSGQSSGRQIGQSGGENACRGRWRWRSPRHRSTPMVQDEAEFAANNPPMVTFTFLANLGGLRLLAWGGSTDPIAVCDAQHGGAARKRAVHAVWVLKDAPSACAPAPGETMPCSRGSASGRKPGPSPLMANSRAKVTTSLGYSLASGRFGTSSTPGPPRRTMR